MFVLNQASKDKIVEDINNSKNNVICIYEFITLRTIFRSIFGWLMFPLSIRSELIINGDILFKIDIQEVLSYHQAKKSMLTLVVRQDKQPGRYEAIEINIIIVCHSNKIFENGININFINNAKPATFGTTAK